MSNTLQVRVNEELLSFFKGDPESIKEALLLYMRAKQDFNKFYKPAEK